ncbi:hypothetical protein ANCCAN_12836 [Ancylostoma caninum]|uniref:Uncharacterized protein n=1 Tax=Ancylostoma caninum TaxID=29170 RepID=A0A368GBX5_ANCCA|nr:hypothetical protein ANCCAN_12836 [Ancylostoma caninum]
MLQKSPVVLIIAGDESEHVARALSKVFCSAFRISSPVVTFDLSSASVRSEFHARLARAVHTTFPLAILNGVDHLGWDAPLVLHAFADDSSMAPPHTLLFLTIKKAFNIPKRECEQSVME